jgi:pimeloyl-ACP methyl ester carboxylesterase
MTDPLPILAVPGLMCSARLYANQIPALWPFGPIMIADHRRDETMDAIARRILATAPGAQAGGATDGRGDRSAGLRAPAEGHPQPAGLACVIGADPPPDRRHRRDSDEMTPPKLAEEIVSRISGARLVLVPDCGHLPTLERPEEVNAALAAWMADKA